MRIGLFDIKKSSPEEKNTEKGLNTVKNDGLGVFYLSQDCDKIHTPENSDLLSCLPDIEPNKGYYFHSDGKFSLHQVIGRILDLIGPAELVASSWSISRVPVEYLLTRKRKGQLTAINLLLDPKVKSFQPKPFQHLIGEVPNVGLYKCHAKISVLRNQEHSVYMLSSSNLTVNRRLEAYTLISSKQLADHYANTWLALIQQNHISQYGLL